jgi:hypothetical protein
MENGISWAGEVRKWGLERIWLCVRTPLRNGTARFLMCSRCQLSAGTSAVDEQRGRGACCSSLAWKQARLPLVECDDSTSASVQTSRTVFQLYIFGGDLRASRSDMRPCVCTWHLRGSSSLRIHPTQLHQSRWYGAQSRIRQDPSNFGSKT